MLPSDRYFSLSFAKQKKVSVHGIGIFKIVRAVRWSNGMGYGETWKKLSILSLEVDVFLTLAAVFAWFGYVLFVFLVKFWPI